MFNKKKEMILIKRLIIWTLYLFSGFILYFQKGNLFTFLITFTKITYPLSIFWVQIRIKKRGNFLPIDSSMSTSQLWFNILPVFASIIAVIISIVNLFFFILEKLINY